MGCILQHCSTIHPFLGGSGGRLFSFHPLPVLSFTAEKIVPILELTFRCATIMFASWSLWKSSSGPEKEMTFHLFIKWWGCTLGYQQARECSLDPLVTLKFLVDSDSLKRYVLTTFKMKANTKNSVWKVSCISEHSEMFATKQCNMKWQRGEST